MAEEEVGFRLALKNRREVERGVHSVGDEFDRVGDEAERAGRKARAGSAGLRAFGKGGRIAGRAAVLGIGAVTAAVVGSGIVLTKLSKDSIAEARESQKVGAITRAEIKSTGRAANVSAKQVGNLAGAISAKVGMDDEAIQSGANMVLTFKNVRNEVGRGNKIFDRATRSAVDLSAAGFGSIVSQSKTLAKALNDPIKGMGALGKSGVTFTEQQQETIKSLVEQGDLLGAQKIILGEVESQVGGVAKAQATWGDKAKVMGDNIKESFGTAILPLLDRTQRWFVREGGPALQGYVDIFEKKGIPKIEEYAGIFERRGIPAMKNFYDEAKPVAESILPAIGTGFSTIADAAKIIAPRMKSIFDGFNGLPDWAKQAIVIGAGGAVIGKKLGAGSLLGKGGLLGGVASMAKPLPVFVVNKGGVPGVDGLGGRGTWKTNAIAAGAGLTAATAAGALAAGGVMKLFEKWAPDSPIKGSPQSSLAAGGGSGPTTNANWRTNDFKDPLGIRKLISGGEKWTGTAEQMERAQGDLNRVFQTGKARGDDLALSLSGVSRGMDDVDREVRPRITLDGIGTAEARLDAFRSKLATIPGIGSDALGSRPTPSRGGPRKRGKGGTTPTITPRTSFPSVDQPTYGDDYFGGDGTGPVELTANLYVDRELVGRTVVNYLETRAANQ